MGSSFSVVNNTSEPIWVSDGVCHAALWGSVGGVLSVVTLGAAAVAGSATAGAGAYLGAVGAFEGAIAEGALIATMEGMCPYSGHILWTILFQSPPLLIF